MDGLVSDCMGIQLNYVVVSGQFFYSNTRDDYNNITIL